jgi:hypothetical protein
MPDEMILESLGVESDEADEGWESDEAFMEADDSAEDLGERAQQRRRRRYNQYRPGRGVRGMTMRDADGRARNVAFPSKLATIAETNRGLASQEVGRRALEERIDRLEARNRQQVKNGSAISGIVTLLIGGGLTAFSLFKAQQGTTGTTFSRWADEDTAKMATLSSVSQLAVTGAKTLVNGRYPRSGIGIAADAFAAVQIAGFTLASLQQPTSVSDYTSVQTSDALNQAAKSTGAAVGDHIYNFEDRKWYVLSRDFNTGNLVAIPQAVNGGIFEAANS